MEISIIIPIYNAEKYLEECLDSVMKATEGVKGEILLIDNNSTDKSLEIARQYEKKHLKLISVLQCNTRGASATRNLGVARARGEYLWFIDADDYIAEDAVKKLLRKAKETDADLVMMRAKKIYPDGSTLDLKAIDTKEPDYKSRFVRYGMGPWQVIIRKKWWLEHGFSFREGMIHEDMELMSALILYTDKFASIDTPLYFYRQTPNSVLHRRSWSEDAYDIFPALEGLYERFKALGAEKQYHDELEWFFIWNLLIDSAKDFAEFPEGKPGFARSRRMLKEYFPAWRKNRFFRQRPLKTRVKILMNYYR